MLDFQPDVIHCNDWQTGLIPVYLKTLYADDDFFRYTAVLFTIHNLSFHGLFDPENAIYRSGLPWSVFNMYGTEFHGRFSFLKGGLYFSDILNTVSKRYCQEIQTSEQGAGLDGLLKHRGNSLYGILNGVDYEIWNPETDPLITKNYSVENTGDKKLNTRALCEISGLDYNENTPVIGMITRLTGQKGLDITAEIIDDLSEKNMIMIILGTGAPYYHKIFADFAGKYPSKISLNLKYDNELSHMIYAGSDIFLMPSKFEPCGISQMISLKYGTIPVVRETGGLADTITGFTGVSSGAEATANGFVFREYNGSALLKCIDRTLETFSDRPVWKKLVLNAMNCDFSWREPAVKYEKLYKNLYALKHGTQSQSI